MSSGPIRRATPLQATRRFWVRSFDPSGRASRSEYWWVTLGGVLFMGALWLAAFLIMQTAPGGSSQLSSLSAPFEAMMWTILVLAIGVPIINAIPGIMLTIRRLHDAGMSGWFILLGWIPLFGPLIVLVLAVLPPSPLGARFDREAVTAQRPAVEVQRWHYAPSEGQTVTPPEDGTPRR